MDFCDDDPFATSDDETSKVDNDLSGKEDEDEDDDFSDIAPYFTPKKFKELSSPEKRSYQNQKLRYENCRMRDPTWNFPPPHFMQQHSMDSLKRAQAAQRQAAKKARMDADHQTTSRRASTRNKKATNSVADSAINSATNSKGEHEMEVESSDSVDDGPDFEVKGYFSPTQWSEMPMLVKRHAQNALEDYRKAQSRGDVVPMPKFMRTPSVTGPDSSISCKNSHSCAGTTAITTKQLPLRVNNTDMPGPSGLQMRSGPSKFSSKNNSSESMSLSISMKSLDNNDTEGLSDVESDSLDLIEPDSDVKSAIEALIRKALPKLEINVISTLQDVLEEKGVESVDDFNLIEASWLEGHGLKDMQLKKIMKEFMNYGSTEKENIAESAKNKTKKVLKPKVPLMRVVPPEPAIASRPPLSELVLDVGVLDLKIEFHKFRDSLLTSLSKKEVPSPQDRLSFVNIISSDIKKNYDEYRKLNPTIKQKTPGRTVYQTVVGKIFEQFEDCFKDVLNNKTFKSGQWTLLDQIETCVENSYRPKTSRGERPVSSKGNRSAACILPEKFSIAMNKQMQGEGESIRRTLVSIFKTSRDKWDWPSIKEMLKNISSLGAQRALINAKDRDITLIIEKWPFLSELSGLLCHLDEITGQSLIDSFENYIDNGMDMLIEYLIAMSPERIKLMKMKRELDFGSGAHRRLLAALMMLATHWKEDVNALISLVEETTLPHEVEDLIPVPPTPHIVALGTSVYTAKKFYVFLNQRCLCSSLQNSLEALMCLCAAYFVFGVLYPATLSNTLTYFERMVANLSDGDGLLKSQTLKGGTAHSSFSKVKKLQDSIDKFEKELHG